VREQLNTPKMLFVYGYVIPVPLERFTDRDEVREGQKNVDQNYYLHAFDTASKRDILWDGGFQLL
jgi:hypothetical protein